MECRRRPIKRELDIDVPRAVLVNPLLKFSLKLNDTQKDYFKTELVKHILGNDYEDLLKAEKHLELLDAVGAGLVANVGAFNNMIQEIQTGVVNGIP